MGCHRGEGKALCAFGTNRKLSSAKPTTPRNLSGFRNEVKVVTRTAHIHTRIFGE